MRYIAQLTPVIKWSIKTVYCNIGIWSLNAAICFKNGEIQNAKLKTVNYNISVLSQPTSCTNHSLRNWTELNFLKLHSVWEFHRFLTEGKSAFFFFFCFLAVERNIKQQSAFLGTTLWMRKTEAHIVDEKREKKIAWIMRNIQMLNYWDFITGKFRESESCTFDVQSFFL